MEKLKFEVNALGTEYFILDGIEDEVGLLLKDEKKTWCARLNMVFYADQLRQIANKLDELNKPTKVEINDSDIWRGI